MFSSVAQLSAFDKWVKENPKEFAVLVTVMRAGHAQKDARRLAGLAARHRREGDGPGCWRLSCVQCGKWFYAERSIARYCGPRCTKLAELASRKARRRLARSKVCGVCGERFTARRDARFCSGRCRQKAFRASLTRKRRTNHAVRKSRQKTIIRARSSRAARSS
jgi:hypothetical protein